MFVRSSLVEPRCPCRDVGEAILVGSLRPIRTARETLGGRTLERPSCGGFMPTAETTLFPAHSARSIRLLTSSARLDNEPNLIDGALEGIELLSIEFIDEKWRRSRSAAKKTPRRRASLATHRANHWSDHRPRAESAKVTLRLLHKLARAFGS